MKNIRIIYFCFKLSILERLGLIIGDLTNRRLRQSNSGVSRLTLRLARLQSAIIVKFVMCEHKLRKVCRRVIERKYKNIVKMRVGKHQNGNDKTAA